MTFRGKLVFGILGAIIVGLVIGTTFLQSSPVDVIVSWVADYNEAVQDAADTDDDDDDSEENEPLERMMVHIDDEISDYAGVELLTLKPVQFSAESKAVARVLDLQALLKLRNQYLQAISMVSVAKVVENSKAMELKRLKSLARGTAAKNVTYAQASLNQASAERRLLASNAQAIKDESLHIWGSEVTAWALAQDSKQWQRLLTHKDSLLLVTLPIDASLSAEVSVIRIARDGKQQSARKAYFVSEARLSRQDIQGETYFFKTSGSNLREGMRLDAWIPQGSEMLTGVFIPNRAIVWSDGQAWAYVELEDDLYQRRSLLSALAAVGGLFIEAELQAGDQLVVRGAQMLLSEEFRWQILDEDDD